MGLTVFWSEFAKLKLEEIYQYYKLKASKKVAKKIINGIVGETIYLDKNPEIGQVESTLKDKTREFRYLVSSNYKIIYYIHREYELIVIASVFDTRQNPSKVANN